MENRAWAQLSCDRGTVDWSGSLLTCQTSGNRYLLRKSEWHTFCIITVRAGITASNLITKIAKFRKSPCIYSTIKYTNLLDKKHYRFYSIIFYWILFEILSLATETGELTTEICKSWSSTRCQIPLTPALKKKKVQLTRVRRIENLHASHA